MKQQPQLHPRDLLAGMRNQLITTPAVIVKLQHHMLSDNGEVEMLLGQDGSFQLQCKTSEASMQLCQALHRLLNVWDINAPRWIWQMDAMLDPVLRQIALDEAKNIRPQL